MKGYNLDSEKLETFVRRLKKTFKLHNLLLTSTFIAVNENLAEVVGIPSLSHHLDFVHFVQKYNLNFKPPGDMIDYAMRIRGIRNMQQTIDGLIHHGISSDKLVIGLQFSGQLFRSVQDFGHFTGPTFRRTLAYNEVCDVLTKLNGWQITYDPESGLTVAKRIELTSGAFLPQISTIIFESGRSIARKIQFALDRKIGGALVFPIDMDDIAGKCAFDKDTFADFKPTEGINLNIAAREDKKFPLLKTVNEAIIAPLEKVEPMKRINAFIPINILNRFEPIDQIASKTPTSATIKITKIRRPIQNIKIPFKSTYDDYDLEVLDSLLSI